MGPHGRFVIVFLGFVVLGARICSAQDLTVRSRSGALPVERRTLDDAISLAGQGAARLPIELTSVTDASAPAGIEAWTVLGDDGRGLRIYVFTQSETFRCASEPESPRHCLLKLASVIVHEAWHFKNGPNEPGAYQAQLAFLVFHHAPPQQIRCVFLSRDYALKELRKATASFNQRRVIVAWIEE